MSVARTKREQKLLRLSREQFALYELLETMPKGFEGHEWYPVKKLVTYAWKDALICHSGLMITLDELLVMGLVEQRTRGGATEVRVAPLVSYKGR